MFGYNTNLSTVTTAECRRITSCPQVRRGFERGKDLPDLSPNLGRSSQKSARTVYCRFKTDTTGLELNPITLISDNADTFFTPVSLVRLWRTTAELLIERSSLHTSTSSPDYGNESRAESAASTVKLFDSGGGIVLTGTAY